MRYENGASREIVPGETKSICFTLAWYVPLCNNFLVMAGENER